MLDPVPSFIHVDCIDVLLLVDCLDVPVELVSSSLLLFTHL